MTQAPGEQPEISSSFCNREGNCCVGNTILLSPRDIKRIAENLETTAAELFSREIITYSIAATGWMHPVINNRQTELNICPFLQGLPSGARICRIHSQRPLACRLFPYSYDIVREKMFLPEKNTERCPGCRPPEADTIENDNREEINYFHRFQTYISELVLDGMNLHVIANHAAMKERFFRLQREIYEEI